MPYNAIITEIPAKKKLPTVTRVGIYARVSTSRASPLRSLTEQVSTLTRHVYDRNDWTLRDVYIDVGSAKTGSIRREFTRMIEDCKSGELDLILVKNSSRMGRDTPEVIAAVREILAAGAVVYLEQNNFLIQSINDELPVIIESGVNQTNNEQRSDNIKLGLVHRAKTGDSGLYNRPCYGYKKNEEGKLVPDPDEAAVVAMIYRLYLDGKSISEIIEEFEIEHVLSPRGSARWNKRAIETILTNVKYAGHVVILRPDPGKDGYAAWNNHDPIISEDEFAEVQNQISKRTRHRRKIMSSAESIIENMNSRREETANGRENTEDPSNDAKESNS